MVPQCQRWLVVFALGAGHGTGVCTVWANTPDEAYGSAVRQAVTLLPRRPQQVLVIDVNDARPEHRANLSKLQAFILRGRRTVYLTKNGEALCGAVTGSRFHLYMLATVIWHEMAHADGADEAEARRQEEALWTAFIRDNVVDRGLGLRYLRALKQRPPAVVQ